MKTLYSRRHNNNRLIIGISSAVLGLIVLVGIRLAAPNAFFALVSPLMQVGTAATASVGDSIVGVTDSSQLAAQNRSLEEEVLTLKNQNAALTARTQDLTKLLGGSSEGEVQGIPAGVLARPPESTYDTLLVAAGSTDGVKIGDEVFAQGGIPIGTIAHADTHSSQVMLFSSAGHTISGWIGTDHIAVSLTGAGAGAFTASLSKDATIQEGAFVYIPGPGAIPMGTVVHVDTDPSSPSATIHIQPNVNIFSVTWVDIRHAPAQ